MNPDALSLHKKTKLITYFKNAVTSFKDRVTFKTPCHEMPNGHN